LRQIIRVGLVVVHLRNVVHGQVSLIIVLHFLIALCLINLVVIILWLLIVMLLLIFILHILATMTGLSACSLH
jgi:hypothetical protein